MKKVLIISYYFPPYTGIEGVRVKSFVDNFYANGIFPIVLTRHWESGAQQTWEDYITEDHKPKEVEKTSTSIIYRLPHKHRPSYNFFESKKRLFPIYYWAQKFLGNIQLESDTINSFYRPALELIKEYKPELILLSAPPFNLAGLGNLLHKKTGVPFIVDFRDAYNNHLLNPNNTFPFKTRLDNYLQGRHIYKSMKNAELAVSIVPSMLNVVLKDLKTPRQIITNGFEQSFFDRFASMPSNPDRFTISILGSLYQGQNFELMTEGFKRFIEICPDVLIQFIGLSRDPTITHYIKERLPAENLYITPRLPREEALSLAASSHVFYMLAWPGYSGLMSGKIYEYLGMRRNILVAPSDKEAIEKLIKDTNSGKVANNSTEMFNILQDWYLIWKQTGRLHFNGNEVINQFSRERQASLLAKKLLELINN